MLLGKVISHKIFSDRILIGCSLVSFFCYPFSLSRDKWCHLNFRRCCFSKLLYFLEFLLGPSVACAMDILRYQKPSLECLGTPRDPIRRGSGRFSRSTRFLHWLRLRLGTVNVFVVLFLLMFLSSVVFSSRDRVLSLCAVSFSLGHHHALSCRAILLWGGFSRFWYAYQRRLDTRRQMERSRRNGRWHITTRHLHAVFFLSTKPCVPLHIYCLPSVCFFFF